MRNDVDRLPPAVEGEQGDALVAENERLQARVTEMNAHCAEMIVEQVDLFERIEKLEHGVAPKDSRDSGVGVELRERIKKLERSVAPKDSRDGGAEYDEYEEIERLQEHISGLNQKIRALEYLEEKYKIHEIADDLPPYEIDMLRRLPQTLDNLSLSDAALCSALIARFLAQECQGEVRRVSLGTKVLCLADAKQGYNRLMEARALIEDREGKISMMADALREKDAEVEKWRAVATEADVLKKFKEYLVHARDYYRSDCSDYASSAAAQAVDAIIKEFDNCLK